MKKRGQFYLVAALVIIAIIASLSAVYNEIKIQKEEVFVYDLSEEINYEIKTYLGSGTFSALSPEEISEYISKIARDYSINYPGIDFIIVYGNRENLNLIAYIAQPQGSVCIEQTCFEVTQTNLLSEVVEVNGNKAKITFFDGDKEVSYSFDIKDDGQNFFLVLQKKDDGEIHSVNPGNSCFNDGDCSSGQICISGNCQTNQIGDPESVSCGGENEICCEGAIKCESEDLTCYDLKKGNDILILDKKCYKKCANLPNPDDYCNNLISNSQINLICKGQNNKCDLLDGDD